MKKQFGLIFDQERCLGCDTCTIACNKENQPVAGNWIWVETLKVKIKDTPEGVFPNLTMDFLPRTCMHCASAPCVETCPTEALVKTEDGPVVLNPDLCDGCMDCMDECPYDAIKFNESDNLVEKCHLCSHRIEEDLEPFCVICCEGQAIHFGDLADPESQVSKLAASQGIFQLNVEAGTRPSVYYLPPMKKRPF